MNQELAYSTNIEIENESRWHMPDNLVLGESDEKYMSLY